MNEVEKALQERFLLQKEYLGENKPVNNITPLVSVTVATYQHVNYIKKCLDGILMQETDFPYEIVLGEDGSTDGTQEICKKYAEKYPDKIRLFIRNRELSQFVNSDGKIIRFNGIWNRMSSRGKFLAWCEGDDYWVCPLKLQKQFNILNNNDEIGLCYTRATVFNQQTGLFQSDIALPYKGFNSMILRNPIVALTVMYRKKMYDDYMKDVNPIGKGWLTGDYPIWLWIAYNSKVHYINESTAVYRYLENSASHSHGNILKQKEFNESIRSIQMYYIDKFNLDQHYVDMVNDEFYRRIVYDGMINHDRLSCKENIKKIKHKKMRDIFRIPIFNSSYLFNFYVRKF